jgi:hypothetical protein
MGLKGQMGLLGEQGQDTGQKRLESYNRSKKGVGEEAVAVLCAFSRWRLGCAANQCIFPSHCELSLA